MNEVTRILSDLAHGDPTPPRRIAAIDYDELRRLAAARLAAEPSGNTFSRRSRPRSVPPAGWDTRRRLVRHRGHFFAARPSHARILVEAARRKKAAKHGGGLNRHDTKRPAHRRAPADEDLVAARRDAHPLRGGRASEGRTRETPFRGDDHRRSPTPSASPGDGRAALGYSKAWLFQAISGEEEIEHA